MARPHFIVASLAVMLSFALAGACSSGTADEAGGSDKCCPLTPPPTTCNGPVLRGGSRAKHPEGCGTGYVDNVPPVSRTIDEDGCPTYDQGAAGQPREPVAYINNCPKREASADVPLEASSD